MNKIEEHILHQKRYVGNQYAHGRMLNFIGYQGIANVVYYMSILNVYVATWQDMKKFNVSSVSGQMKGHIKITGPSMAPGKWVRARWPMPLQMLQQSTPSHVLGSSYLGSPRENLLTILFYKSKTQTQRPPQHLVSVATLHQHLALLFPAGRAQRMGPGETVKSVFIRIQ